MSNPSTPAAPLPPTAVPAAAGSTSTMGEPSSSVVLGNSINRPPVSPTKHNNNSISNQNGDNNNNNQQQQKQQAPFPSNSTLESSVFPNKPPLAQRPAATAAATATPLGGSNTATPTTVNRPLQHHSRQGSGSSAVVFPSSATRRLGGTALPVSPNRNVALSSGGNGDDDDYDDEPKTFILNRNDPQIDERAEFLGMDVQDFRELLVIASRRHREQLAVDSGEQQSSVVFGRNHSGLDGNSERSSGGLHSAGSPVASSAILETHVPNDAIPVLMTLASQQQHYQASNATRSRSDLPSSSASAAGGATPNANAAHDMPIHEVLHGGGSQAMFGSSSNQTTHTLRSETRASQVSSSVGIAVGRMPRMRESVASLVRMVGDGLFGRRVMWADEELDDEDEVIEEEFIDSVTGSSTASRDHDSLLSAQGENGSFSSSSHNASAQRAAALRRRVSKAERQPLVRVTTYELNGQMLMGVTRVGQWRGWLWLAAYMLYHILIEYSAAYVGANAAGHGRQVLRARAWGAVVALLIALCFVGISRCVKNRPASRSRTAWSLSTNGLLLMSGCGMLLGAFEAFFWGSLHSKFPNGALVVYPTMFIGPIVVIVLRRPFFPSRYNYNPASQIPERVRQASSGGGTGEGKVVYATEALCCAVVIVGSVVMCVSFPGTIPDWKCPILLQLGAATCAAVALVCLAVLAQRGLLRYSIIAITSCRALGYFALMFTSEVGTYDDATSLVTQVPPVLWLSLLMGLDYILFLSACMRSNMHLDIMAVVVVQLINWIEVPVLSVILAPKSHDYVQDLGQIDPLWALWLGAFVVIGGAIGLGVFATARQQFVLFDLWRSDNLFVKPKGMKGTSGNTATAPVRPRA